MAKIAFLIHPFSIEVVKKNLFEFYPQLALLKPFLRRVSDFKIKDIYSHLPVHEFMLLKNIKTSTGIKFDFTGIMVPFFPELFFINEKKSIEKVRKGIQLAEKKEADFVALGGFTSIVGDQGRETADGFRLAVTSGNSFTAFLCIEGILKSCKILDKKMGNSTICIVGATGDIGSICSRVFSKIFKKVILCSRTISQEHPLFIELNKINRAQVEVNQQIESAAKESDVVLLTTSAVGIILEARYLKKGSIVCDVAIPYNISRTIRKDRKDFFVFDGGKASIPFYGSIDDSKWKAMFPSNSIYGCLAEALLLTFDRRFVNYSIGRGNITEEKIDEMRELSRKFGVGLADFSCGEYFYTKNDIANIKQACA